MTVGNLRLKAAARNAPLVVKKSLSPSRMVNSFSEHHHESKVIKNKLGTSVGLYRKRSIEPKIKADYLSHVKIQSKHLLGSSLDGQEVLNHQSGMTRLNDAAKRSRTVGELVNKADMTSSRLEVEAPPKIRRMERNDSEILPDLNSPGDLYSLQRVVRVNFLLKCLIFI